MTTRRISARESIQPAFPRMLNAHQSWSKSRRMIVTKTATSATPYSYDQSPQLPNMHENSHLSYPICMRTATSATPSLTEMSATPSKLFQTSVTSACDQLWTTRLDRGFVDSLLFIADESAHRNSRRGRE